MSIFVNRIHGYLKKSGKLIGGVEVALYSQSILSVIDSTHTYRGYYEFTDVNPGFYNVQFYGRGMTEREWLYGVQVVDEPTAGDSAPPTSSVVESATLET